MKDIMMEKFGKKIQKIVKGSVEMTKKNPKGPKDEDFPLGSIISRDNGMIYSVELPNKQGLLLFNKTTGLPEEAELPDKTIFYSNKGKKIRIKYKTGEEEKFDNNEQLVSRRENNQLDIYENGFHVARVLKNGDKQIIKDGRVIRTVKRGHNLLGGKK